MRNLKYWEFGDSREIGIIELNLILRTQILMRCGGLKLIVQLPNRLRKNDKNYLRSRVRSKQQKH